MPACWSYARTSTARQAGSDKSGLARQEAALNQWLRDHPDYQLQAALVDPGISGSGAHRKRGAMGKFLAAAEAGTVPPGSALVVESLTRFGRETPREALGVLLGDFWARGLSLAICGQSIYSPELIDKEPHHLHVLLALIQQSRAEWEERSKRSRGARIAERKAQEEGIKVRSRVPFFIKRDSDRIAVRDEANNFQLDPVNTKTVRRIIELHMSGHGGLTISRILHDEKRPVPLFAQRWNESQVRKILHNPNIMGSLQRIDGKVIPGYYPAIVTPAEFEAIQNRFRSNKGIRLKGTYGAVWNLAQGISYCSKCGGPISQCRGGSKGAKRYVRCRRAMRELTCDQTKAIDLNDWESMLLATLESAHWEALLSRPEDNAALSELEQEAQATAAQLDSTKARLKHAERLAEDLFLSGGSETRQATAERAIQRLKADVEQLTPATEEAQQRLAIAQSSPSPATLAEAINDRLQEFRGKLDDPATRQTFNRWLKTVEPAVKFTLCPNDETLSLQVGDRRIGPMPIDGATARSVIEDGGHSLVTRKGEIPQWVPRPLTEDDISPITDEDWAFYEELAAEEAAK